MPSRNKLEQSLVDHGVDDNTIDEIVNISYKRCGDKYKNNANYFYEAMKKCEELIDPDLLGRVMGEICCSTNGSISAASRKFAKDNKDMALEEKIKLLEHVSKPWFVDSEHIASYITGEHETACSCWMFAGRTPDAGRMPLSYCLCCAGFLQYHYQKSLGIELKIDRMMSSLLNGDKRCAAVYEIIR
jgi:hypothetical protein